MGAWKQCKNYLLIYSPAIGEITKLFFIVLAISLIPSSYESHCQHVLDTVLPRESKQYISPKNICDCLPDTSIVSKIKVNCNGTKVAIQLKKVRCLGCVLLLVTVIEGCSSPFFDCDATHFTFFSSVLISLY